MNKWEVDEHKHIGSTPTFLYFDLYLHTAYASHSIISTMHIIS